MKKEYTTPELEVIALNTEEIMEKGGIALSQLYPNDEMADWGEGWN